MGTTPGLDSSSREVGERHTRYAESALLLYARLLRARTPEGWEVTDLLAAGASQKEAAAHLGISASAVSQRVRRSGWFEQVGAEALVCHHLSVADGRTDP
jgi:FixJ family two-component response regulator